MKTMNFAPRLGHLLSLLVVYSTGVSCVSSEKTAVSSEAPPVLNSESGSVGVPSISFRSDELIENRIKKLNEFSRSEPRTPPLSIEATSDSAVSMAMSLESNFSVWVNGGQWHEGLVRTAGIWSNCIKGASSLSQDCVLVGKARALSFAKLGNIESSLDIYDELSALGSKSHSVFFARLLSSRKSDNLCAHLAQIGLSEGGSDSREELHSLNVGCLRRAGRSKEAEKFLNIALLEYPKSQSLMLESALNLLHENKLTQGCALLEQLIASNFSKVAVLYNWGQCLVRRADPDAIQTVLARGQKEWPAENVWLILAGELARIEGNKEAARRYGLEYLAGADLSDDLKMSAESLAEL